MATAVAVVTTTQRSIEASPMWSTCTISRHMYLSNSSQCGKYITALLDAARALCKQQQQQQILMRFNLIRLQISQHSSCDAMQAWFVYCIHNDAKRCNDQGASCKRCFGNDWLFMSDGERYRCEYVGDDATVAVAICRCESMH
jgi:hypothetical protein